MQVARGGVTRLTAVELQVDRGGVTRLTAVEAPGLTAFRLRQQRTSKASLTVSRALDPLYEGCRARVVVLRRLRDGDPWPVALRPVATAGGEGETVAGGPGLTAGTESTSGGSAEASVVANRH